MAVDLLAPLFLDPKRLFLDRAREHVLADLLRLVVDRLAASPRVALARVWLVQRSEDCTGCPMAAECPDRSACLHLAASAGRPVADPRVEWARLDGAFRRFPLGVRKVGRIAATGEPVEAPDLWPDPPAWAAGPDWMRAEGVAGFGGQPLVHRGKVLGVLAVFAREPIGAECMDRLRTVADHAAAAIATARTFAEIDGLRKRLEAGNIRAALRRAGDKVSGPGGAAELLGVKPTTLASRIKALGLLA